MVSELTNMNQHRINELPIAPERSEGFADCQFRSEMT